MIQRLWSVLVIIIVVAALFGISVNQKVTILHATISTLSVAAVLAVMEYRLTTSGVVADDDILTPPSLASLLESTEDTPGSAVVEMATTNEDQKKIHQKVDKYDFLTTSKDYADKDQSYYVNKGDLIDKEWKDKFTILDTKHWKPYTDPPPVCLDKSEPCAPCPVVMHSPYLDLSQFRRTLIERA